MTTTETTDLRNVTAALRVANSQPDLPVPSEFRSLNYFPDTSAEGYRLMSLLSNEFGNELVWAQTLADGTRGQVIESARHRDDLHKNPMFRVFLPEYR